MSACITCGKSFQCGMADAGAAQPCWCTQLPPLPAAMLEAAAAQGRTGCYCADCLRALVDANGDGRADGNSDRRVDGGIGAGTADQQ